jgi:hypothetical protein
MRGDWGEDREQGRQWDHSNNKWLETITFLSFLNSILTRPVAREDFIAFSRHESFKSYNYFLLSQFDFGCQFGRSRVRFSVWRPAIVILLFRDFTQSLYETLGYPSHHLPFNAVCRRETVATYFKPLYKSESGEPVRKFNLITDLSL